MTEPKLTAAEQYMRDLWISEQWKPVREWHNDEQQVTPRLPHRPLKNPEARIRVGVDNGHTNAHTER